MLSIRLLYIIIICTLLSGCATIFNGSTQDVSVIMPPGTQVSDAFGNNLMVMRFDSLNTTLRLKRKNDYSLRFLYKGQEATVIATSSLEPAWILADLPIYYVGYIVDGITGDWNSFNDHIIVNFPTDTSRRGNYLGPSVEIYNGIPPSKIGIILAAKLGLVFPMTEALAGSYGIGIGYEAFPRFTFLVSYDGGSGVNILPKYSNYTTHGSYDHFNLECRYKMEDNFYICGGGGFSNITSDSVILYRQGYNDTTGKYFDNSLRSDPTNKWMPTLFAGIGIAGTTSYFEIRQTFGLAKIPLSSGETGHFTTTTLTFGVNLHF